MLTHEQYLTTPILDKDSSHSLKLFTFSCGTEQVCLNWYSRGIRTVGKRSSRKTCAQFQMVLSFQELEGIQINWIRQESCRTAVHCLPLSASVCGAQCFLCPEHDSLPVCCRVHAPNLNSFGFPK